MANELQRVGLVFTSEGAVDFKKTLQEINLEMNKNYNQFKLTQAQWDSSTKSSEKLRAQQEYLTNAYAIQQDKVTTLKMQLSDLENAENKNTTAIKKKRNELTNAEVKLLDYQNKLKDVENQLNNSGKKIEESGRKIEKFGEKIEGAGKKVSAFSLATGTALVASAKSAIDFESAFTGVEKTVDGTEQQMAELEQGIRNMAKEIPSSTTEIAAVAEAAGQLGIKTEDILSFTRVMIDLGNSTNLSAEEAASALAKFANITNMSADDYSKLGATIVDLGNNFATTEADIVEMATRLAATGDLAGLSQSQILALATAMSSVGIEAEAGGSAMSKLLKQIQVAVETGSNDLQDFASVAGMSSSEFKKAFEQDAIKALTAFITGLNDTKRNGKSAIAILDDMGLTEVRLSNTILSLANASDVMTGAIETAGTAWEENAALTNEANKRYNTLESKIKITINKLKDFATTIGNKLMPSISKIVDKIGDFSKWLENLSEEQVDFIVNIGLMVTAIGPLITFLGKITTTAGTVIKTIGMFSQAIGVVEGTVTTASTAVNGLAKIIGGLTSPVGLVITAISLLAAGIAYLATRQTEAQKKAQEFAEEIQNEKQAFDEYNESIDKATSSNLAQINSVERLKNELSTLVDENGKVKEGYEGRVSFILNQLNDALDTEYRLNGNIIQSYKDLQAEIDKTIEKKRAEIKLNGEEEKYANAVNEEEAAVKNLTTAREKLLQVQDEYGMTLDELRDKAANSSGKEKEYLDNVIGAYDTATQTLKQNTDIQKQYANDYALFMEGKYNEVGESIKNTTSNWTDATLENIRTSITEQAKALENYKAIYDSTGSEIAKTQMEQAQQNMNNLINELTSRTSTITSMSGGEIAAWRTLATESYEEYSKAISNMEPEMQQKIQNMTGIVASNTSLPNSIAGLANRTESYFQTNLNFERVTGDKLSKATETINNDRNLTLATGNLANESTSRFQTYINSQNGKNATADYMQGAENGINQKKKSFWDLLFGIGRQGNKSMRDGLGDGSPSVLAEEALVDYFLGADKGIEKQGNKTIENIQKYAQKMNTNFNKTLETPEIGTRKLEEQGIKNEINKSNQYKREGNSNIDYEKMANAFLQALNSSGITNRIEDILNKILITGKNQKIVLNSGELVGATASLMDEELNNIKSREERGS